MCDQDLADDRQPSSPVETSGCHAERIDRLRNDAIATWKAMDGWQGVQSDEEWVKACQEAQDDYLSGRFLIERLGAERHLDPKLMATLLTLHEGLLDEHGRGATARMLIDFTIIAYAHAMRVNKWIGNFAMLIEHEFFGLPSPTAEFKKNYRHYPGVEGISVENAAHRVGEELVPLLDRANRMVVRNIRMLQELRTGPVQAVAIGQASQVNIGQQQINAAIEKTERQQGS